MEKKTQPLTWFHRTQNQSERSNRTFDLYQYHHNGALQWVVLQWKTSEWLMRPNSSKNTNEYRPAMSIISLLLRFQKKTITRAWSLSRNWEVFSKTSLRMWIIFETSRSSQFQIQYLSNSKQRLRFQHETQTQTQPKTLCFTSLQLYRLKSLHVWH